MLRYSGLFTWGTVGLWLVASNLAELPVYIEPLGFPPLIGLLQAMGYMGFSSFVFVIALVARRQAEARDEQRRLNAELRATRALLAESARVNERTRISRELHDLLGHQLTALALNLEVAGHLAEGPALDHVKRSHGLAKLLLTNVREVVSQLRETGAIDLAAALRPLTEHVPSLDIQLEIEEPLNVEDPQRAHVLLRCTQEIITNTVRHAGAQHLWIRVWREAPDVLVIEARDDGVGAEAVNVGNGLRGMRERLEQCGGALQIETRRGEGFCLRASVPGTPVLLLATVS
jgi:signal transduction histidine kinase